MRSLLLLALLAGARSLAAFGGTSEPWLGGTQPWDTVPFMELNFGLHAIGGQGRPALGPNFQAGILDPLMLSGFWLFPVDAGVGRGQLRAVVREASFPSWRPALALSADFDFNPDPAGAVQASYVPYVIAALEPWDQSIVLNVEPQVGGRFRLGYWSPYLVHFFRLGLELETKSSFAGPTLYTPQCTIQLPGDLSAVLGAQTRDNGSKAWTWLAQVSWQIFPSP